MTKDNVLISKTIKLTQNDLDSLKRQAARFGFLFEASGKPNVMPYIVEKLRSDGDSLNKIDGYDDILNAFNELRAVRNIIAETKSRLDTIDVYADVSADEFNENCKSISEYLRLINIGFETLNMQQQNLLNLFQQTNKSLEQLAEEKNVLY